MSPGARCTCHHVCNILLSDQNPPVFVFDACSARFLSGIKRAEYSMLAQAILETKVEVDGPAFRDAALHFSSQSNR